ncbi:MAG: class I SAM-dependent methyltransferase [Chloroflexi bacterium]|nr:class I SAM-dependent methyltransferase [Chloroflexota bacterium]
MSEFYNTIARFYDAENQEMTDDLSLYSDLAEVYGQPILDVGCGTGRVMFHLAQEGYQCVGIDTSPPMLARARQKAASLPILQQHTSFIQADVASYRSPDPFRLILLPYHTFMHFRDQETQLSVLTQLTANLAAEGAIVFDLPNAGEAFSTQDDHALAVERTFIDPHTGNVVMQQSVSSLDRVTQLLQITWIYDEISADGAVHRTIAPLILRYVFFEELRLLLRLAKLRISDVYGDYDQQPFADGSPRMIVVAVK